MIARGIFQRRFWLLATAFLLVVASGAVTPAQQWVTETRDPKQTQDEDFAKAYREWTGEARYGSPLVDHLPKVPGVPSPKDVLGYHVGAPQKLTYYADIVKYYRALAAASPRVKVETIGRSDEDRELVVVWVSSDSNIKNLQQNRDNLAKIADPRGLTDAQVRQLIASTKPHYHLMGGLHSGETGPSEMLMELVYRLATETSPFISQIRDNVIVSVTPVADADGRDRNVDWFYRNQEMTQIAAAGRGGAGGPAGPAPAAGGGGGSVPYWGKYVYHDNNRDINLSQVSMRAITNWYYTAHPPIMHDLHESLSLLYTYSGGPPQNPNLDPLLFAELSFFANWELAQMTKWGMPGVYTHAFMDGWSPGYLGSVAYNHNGMMKMYETQSGRDITTPIPTTLVTPGGAGAAGAAAGGRGSDVTAGGRGAAAAGGGRGDAGGRGARGAGAGAAAVAGQGAGAAAPAGRAAGAGRGGVPTGRGGGQNREWYRGIPVPPGAVNTFTRRNNTNYMQTGVLSSLQLASMFPNLVIENFYTKTKNSIQAGLTQAPYGYVIPVQRDMTKPAELVRILKLQGIEVGTANAEIKIGDAIYPAGSYVIKGGQPYWRLAKNLLERQNYPDPALRTYDDSGWTMGLAFNVDVKEIADRAILDAPTTLVKTATVRGVHMPTGAITCDGSVWTIVLHHGSNNMVTFRYRMKDTPMKITNQTFTVDKLEIPAGSFVVSASDTRGGAVPLGDNDVIRAAHALGLNTTQSCGLPVPVDKPLPMHDADVPRVAIYSNWGGTQELGWYRHAFDQFGIPFDLIYKERVRKGNLKADYDVILMAAQSISRGSVMTQPAARPQPYLKSDKYKFLGMYGETPDMTGGFGQEGVNAFEKFLEAGGTLITTLGAVRFPIEFGFARSIDTEPVTGLNAQKPLVQAEIVKTDHPVFFGYAERIIPVKYGQGQQVFRVGVADQGNVLARFVGGDASVLSGLGEGADALRQRVFAMDIPEAFRGKGRVIMFSGNPIYRWQNHGEFNMVFNSIMNWNDR